MKLVKGANVACAVRTVLRPRRRMGAIAIAVMGLLVSGLPATWMASAAASARSPAAVTAGSRYLALGDSVTFGYQEPQVVPAPKYHNARSFLGYPEHIRAALRLAVTNAACPGETSASFLNVHGPSNSCENSPTANAVNYRQRFPLHVRYRAGESQLAFALAYLKAHRDTRVVSLMIGANDLLRCQKVTADACTSSREISATASTTEKNVRKILSAIRGKAHYGGQVVIVHYYSLDYGSAFLNALSQLLNHALDTAAKPFHVTTADGYGELQRAARTFGGHTCAAGLLTEWTSGSATQCGVHPSFSGQALLAEAVEKVLRR